MNYYNKYLKYKLKYNNIKNIKGGSYDYIDIIKGENVLNLNKFNLYKQQNKIINIDDLYVELLKNIENEIYDNEADEF
jgi:hypothetical protein